MTVMFLLLFIMRLLWHTSESLVILKNYLPNTVYGNWHINEYSIEYFVYTEENEVFIGYSIYIYVLFQESIILTRKQFLKFLNPCEWVGGGVETNQSLNIKERRVSCRDKEVRRLFGEDYLRNNCLGWNRTDSSISSSTMERNESMSFLRRLSFLEGFVSVTIPASLTHTVSVVSPYFQQIGMECTMEFAYKLSSEKHSSIVVYTESLRLSENDIIKESESAEIYKDNLCLFFLSQTLKILRNEDTYKEDLNQPFVLREEKDKYNLRHLMCRVQLGRFFLPTRVRIECRSDGGGEMDTYCNIGAIDWKHECARKCYIYMTIIIKIKLIFKHIYLFSTGLIIGVMLLSYDFQTPHNIFPNFYLFFHLSVP
uniref:Uncharacterized protein n=1 Tax=Heterorhabditis bacteriophora TaxID=37862 RepID=A0A1I7W8Q9_HETBA